jgi:hypothetical protein
MSAISARSRSSACSGALVGNIALISPGAQRGRTGRDSQPAR